LRRDPLPDHVAVYEAVAARDAPAARAAMAKLIELARLDTTYLRKSRPGP
jgi:DNA-binding FadR family transcriptional regulator